MDPETFGQNAAFTEREIAWLRQVMDRRLELHANGGVAGLGPDVLSNPPDPGDGHAPYPSLVRSLGMSAAERLVLILALVPDLKPDLLDSFLIRNQALDRRFTEFGGVIGQSHGGFLPTCETAVFLLAGEDIAARLRSVSLFRADHFFAARNLLRLDHRHEDEPALSAVLQPSAETREYLTTGQPHRPPLSSRFPAERITTRLRWEDLVLDSPTLREVEDIVTWARRGETIMDAWGLKTRIKPGFRSLFSGGPGTGKTLTACLLGQRIDVDVYRVDLSKVVSKYIGETEKNLASLFDQAENREWILFFDEADSLFGRRTETRNSNDQAANQQVSYLLQRIEDYPGIAILATNLKSNLDEAFSRRFQSIIHFARPGFEERLRLWEDNFRDKPFEIAPGVDLAKLARDYELTGGGIINVLRYACLKAVTRAPARILHHDLLEGIGREMQKEGRYLRHPE